MWAQAKKLRAELARTVDSAPSALKKYSKFLKNSFLLGLAERDPKNLNEQTLLFSLAISDCAVKHLLARSLDWSERLTCIGHVVELGARFFLDPKDPLRVIDNLAASKDQGYFFTPQIIAEKMVALVQEDRSQPIISLLDPACGAGNLLGYSLLGLSKLQRVVGVENDKFTAHIAKTVLTQLAKDLGGKSEVEIVEADGVGYLLSLGESREERFDAVIMNPPYGQIRHLRSSLSDKQTASTLDDDQLEWLHSKIRESTIQSSQQLKGRLKHFGVAKGTPEYSRVFLRMAMEAVKDAGRVVAITPATWLGDNSTADLREYILTKNYLRSIISFKETTKLFQTVNQHTAIASIEVGTQGHGFNLLAEVDSVADLARIPAHVDLETIRTISPKGLRIANLDVVRSSVLTSLHKHGSLGSKSEITNLRGECDLTVFKAHIRNTDTGLRLIRGDHIERFELIAAGGSEKAGYLDRSGFEKQIGNVPKFQHSRRWRIVVPQCSYIQQKRRLAFCLVPPGVVVANSANYLLYGPQVDRQKKPPAELLALLGVLNSSIAEWRFRIFNSNNHVGNYEIDELPLPDDFQKNLALISDVRELLKLRETKKEPERARNLDLVIEARVAQAYGLTDKELQLVLDDIKYERAEELLNVARTLRDAQPAMEQELWNHSLPGLSALDREIISYVPRGGNWQNIPESVPSQRLKQIREMSKERGVVRTTYYGRLRLDQPAYTIATYYNRPGNGTNIHPFEDRTLTSREAARLQSFPDSFRFLGSEGAVRKQVGNAVPPLLGYAVGRLFKSTTCVDLFCGAGGLSYGMALAGHEVLAALDNNKDAIETFRANHAPGCHAVCDDITQEEVREKFIARIRAKLGRQQLGLLVGGPPCQGFSTAGWRKAQDQRNGLVSYFLRIADVLEPRVICIENVEGLLSMNSGQVVRDIHEVLRGMGYVFHNEPWLLRAEEYGVPQMRRRVMIVAARNEKELPHRPEAIFSACKGRRELSVDRNCIAKPYPITVLEALSNLPELMKAKRQMTKEEAQFCRPHYARWCKGEIRIEDFVSAFSMSNSRLPVTSTCPKAIVKKQKTIRVPEPAQSNLFEL